MLGAVFSLTHCAVQEENPGQFMERSQAATAPAPNEGCGYRVETGTHSTWPGGYQAWVKVTNVSGATGVGFNVLLDLGGTSIQSGYQAVFTPVSGGYMATEPSWLQYQKIPKGSSYQFGFVGSGTFAGLQAFVTNINDAVCDAEAPIVDLSVNDDFVTAAGTLILSATASDNINVRKVVFLDGETVLGEDNTAPYTFDVALTADNDGRHVYTAKAVDPSGNEGSDAERVLVAIGEPFLGTAVDGEQDYVNVPTYFDQITPENSAKWGSVEAVRDVMDWTQLDVAYNFAAEHGLIFKFHTLFWGQQQPAWLAALPPAEQLEEIHEWLAAVAERYPNLPLVEVVNEPMHSVPSYAGALGGAGESGYDWMIEAFELARTYFPKSELLLNDYNVLIWGDFTNSYLTLVNLLLERKLIDGIGLQSHFLEQADNAVVEANLASLANTGLPIYITELDLDLANDAHHANRIRDLFTIFWNNPSVVGITHWGHLQGSTWQQDAYLIRQDGSFRPGFEWILCKRSGATDCPVPEYVPPTRTGGEYGITLEAEEYDSAAGLLALGDVVAYTDSGDWLSYSDVLFQDNWDTFSVTYAKGSTQESSLSIYVDNVDGAPVLTVPLPPTDGWGSTETVEVPWTPITGNHKIYVLFNGGYGVANVDSFRFGTEPPVSEVNLVANGNFESGNTNGWYGWNGTTLGINENPAFVRSGSYSMLRAGGGTAATDLTAQVQPGLTYTVSFWVLTDGAPSSSVHVTSALNCGGSTSYNWLANNGAIPAGTWTQLVGSLTIPADCSVSQLQVYTEGQDASVNLYIDDVVVLGPPPAPVNLIANGDFETDSNGWYGWSSTGTLEVSSEYANSGTNSLRRTGGGTAATDVTAVVAPGHSYNASFWVRIENAASAGVHITSALNCGGSTSYAWLANNGSIAAGSWVQLSGNLTIPAECSLTQLQLYAEGQSADVDLYLDTVTLVQLP